MPSLRGYENGVINNERSSHTVTFDLVGFVRGLVSRASPLVRMADAGGDGSEA
jgi:hypothetical protein